MTSLLPKDGTVLNFKVTCFMVMQSAMFAVVYTKSFALLKNHCAAKIIYSKYEISRFLIMIIFG